jgi:hypothetical protein
MNEKSFLEKLKKGIARFYESKDSQLINKTLNINERSVTHKLAMFLTPLFSKYDVDCEYNRMIDHGGTRMEGDLFVKKLGLEPIITTGEDDEGTTVYPDIIIHKRKQPVNIAVIEVKMKWKSSRKEFDYKKLRAYKRDLKYDYAIYLELDETNYLIDLIQL